VTIAPTTPAAAMTRTGTMRQGEIFTSSPQFLTEPVTFALM
jgi:hypothetical protein